MSAGGANLDFSKSVPLGATEAPPAGNLDFAKAVPVGETDSDPGYLINDVGNKVIVPKQGEEFSDTLKRAVEHWKSLPKEEQQKQIGKEVATMPEKVPEALTGAALAGIAGPAALALPGEAVEGAKALSSAPLGMQPPLLRAIPHIYKFAQLMRDLGIGAGGVGLALKLFMSEDKK